MFKSRLLFIFFLLLFLSVIGKLFYLQVVNPKISLEDLYLRDKKIYPSRGKILDRVGEPLAINKPTYLLYFEPKKINDTDKVIHTLDQILNIGEATLETKLDKSKDWVVVKRDIDKKTKEKIGELDLSGIGFEENFKRDYPEASLAAHLLGFVGKDYWGGDVGYFGIEGFYNKDLTGLPGVFKSERDLFGRPILMGTQERIEPENGRNLYLTIDKSIQSIAKKRLLQGLKSYQAEEGCVLIANPANMEILALVCLPDFDLDQYYLFSEDYFKNPAISNLYEPGSIFKPLVMASAIEEKAVKPNDLYDEKGPVDIGEYSIKTWNNQYEGKINMTRIIEKSSNVGMVYVGQKLGEKKLYSYLNKFGLGELTGIDLQGEMTSYLKPINQWYPIDFATVTFGQGIAVTPIQMIRAFASLINGGKLFHPYVMNKVGLDNNMKQTEPRLERNVISGFTSEVIKKMLLAAVDNGEVKWAKPAGYQIGGKTGTAQIPISGHYDPSKTIASFVGFAPVDDPKFICLVILREPKTSPWGSETAAPLFFEIAKDLIVYYGITPEQ
ncbi:hypothetical protein COS51_01285 [Candidatus Roizmanbacteria bacterium CG03_land_8_20_14_0_80_36_21]|nr:MAG: hypothetical protein COS51_01285 [Candidatus Roizmanbacteria bacterium CG03_land_8_20_14_0_80_36_21]